MTEEPEEKKSEKGEIPKVIPITPRNRSENIYKTLRKIAKDLKNDEFGLITSAILVLGHTRDVLKPDAEDKDNSIILTNEKLHVFMMGPKQDIFTARGLLASGLNKIMGFEEEPE